MADAIAIQSTQATQSGGGSSLWIGMAVIALIIILVMVIIALIIWFIIKYFKQKNDLLLNIRRARLKMCFVHKELPSKRRWFKWRISKNPPIRCMYFDKEKKLHITKPIAYYLGHSLSEEGNMIISFYIPTSNYFFIFPKAELLMINNKEQRTIYYQDKQTQKEEKIELKLPTSKDIVSINKTPPEVILHHCKGIDIDSSLGMFYLPVITGADERTIDLNAVMMQSIREIATIQMYLDQLTIQAKTNQLAVKGNPGVRISQQLGDTNQTIEQKPY